VAGFHVDGPVTGQRRRRRGGQQRQIVGVGVHARFIERDALGTVRDAEHLQAVVVVVDPVGAQVVAPDHDVGEFGGQLQLGRRAVERLREPVDRGVVDHDPDGTLGPALGRVLHLPLRMDPACAAVGVHDAEVLGVAPGLQRRLLEDRGRLVFGVNAAHRIGVVGRALGRCHAPEAEHVAVPAAHARRNLALPHAEPAEVLRHVEQLGLALRLRGERAAGSRVLQCPQRLGVGSGGARLYPQRGAGAADQAQGVVRRQLAGLQGLQHGAARRREGGARLQQLDQIRGLRGCAGRAEEGSIGPDDQPVGRRQQEQVVALRQPGRQNGLRRGIGRRGRGVHRSAGVRRRKSSRQRLRASRLPEPACRSFRR
jgi:hypothetical protein